VVRRFDISVYGRVQRIGFRFSTMEAAYRFGVKGFVENKPDGSVHIEAEGDVESLEKFMDWCRKGPIGARVDKLETKESEPIHCRTFEIR
jgi:acylphosphatase